MSDDPTPVTPPAPPVVPVPAEKPSNETITDNLFTALQGDESLTDEDRRAIAEGLTTKTGGKIPEVVHPDTEHWSTRKLF